MHSEIPTIGEFISCPWTPRMIVAIEPYTGKYREWFDCVLVISTEQTKSGRVRMTYNSSNWAYDQHEVRRWREENEKK